MHTDNIIHKSEAVTDLFELINSERFPHALLLKGAEGRGKLALARSIAQYLVCTDRKEGDSCGKCSHCHKSLKNIHPDIHYSFPINGAKATCNDFMNDFRAFIAQNHYAVGSDWITEMSDGKKAGNMTAAECNRISHIVHLKPYESEKKIILIWLPEYLGKEGNRLLKMIEEPPEETYFIFISDQPELILGTILSRCQTVNIPPIPVELIANYVANTYNLDSETASVVSNLSDGNINDAIKMSNQVENKFLPTWIAFFKSTYSGHTASISKSVKDINEFSKEEMKTFFKYCIHFLRQCMLLRHLPEEHVHLRKEELDIAKKMAGVIDDEAIHNISAMLDKVSYYLERNANMKSALLSIAIQMNHIFKKDALAA